MNSVCSNQSKGWICIRAQHLERILHERAANNKNNKKLSPNAQIKSNWCSGADDWGDDTFDDDGVDKNTINSSNQMQLVGQQQQPIFDDNLNEQNGNTVSNNMMMVKHENRNQSDDEDESNSMDDPIVMFGNLQVIDDKNANCNEQGMFIELNEIQNCSNHYFFL